jgi:hypothetical protein
MHFNLSAILEQAMLQSDSSGWWWKEHIKGSEGDEVCSMEFFDVRQVAPVVTLHRCHSVLLSVVKRSPR